MDNEEFELRLLKGSSIDFDGLKIPPLTLTEIIDEIGYEKYQNLISVLSIDKSKLQDVPEEIVDKVTNFDIFIADARLMELLIDFLRTFIKYKNIYYIEEYGTIVVDYLQNDMPIFINSQNLDRLFNLFKKMYCVKFEEEQKFKAGNERARQYIERMKKERENLPKPKSNVDLMSIISGVSHKSPTINIFNVWNLSIYQLWDAYYRLDFIDNCDKTLSGIYAGTIDQKSIDFKNLIWIKRLDKNS